MLTIFGSINIDQVIRVTSIPAPGETVIGERVMNADGGKGANQAVAAARVGAGEISVTMVGAVGDDAHGDAAFENFATNGVVSELMRSADCATGTAFITLSDEGENAITVIPGANSCLSHIHLSAETMARTSVLLCQGEVPFEESVRAMAALREAREDATILLNLAPVPTSCGVQIIKDALNICDILIVNELEAEAVVHLLEAGGLADLPVLAREHGCSVVITQGPQGAELIRPSGECAHTPSPRIDPVDTTGAGDTFCGVFAILLAEGWDTLAAITTACEAAAKACGAIGAQAAMPHRTQLFKDHNPS
ncbi:ribokinase [Yoonia sp.]|uniref:ribokinase n=1 Tax=Yoonia sp. TaxID=2212373 RepID=UPI002E0A9924|nr:ribokinase [Yoonia sp.]